ncbi:SDR family oxidoreductase [Actinomycetota bacterium]
MDLNDKVAIVTGASKGIGRSISILLAKQGVKVVLVARNIENLKEIQDIIASFNGTSITVPTDISKVNEIIDLFKRTKKEFGGLDILINNAALVIKGKLVDFSTDDYDKIMNINLKGVFVCCQQALKIMIPQKSGFIINIGSNAVFRNYPEDGAYTASKHGMVGITKTIANEVQHYGIHTALVHPGAVDTEMSLLSRPDLDRSVLIPPDDIAQTVLYMLQLSDSSWVDEIYIRRREAKPF